MRLKDCMSFAALTKTLGPARSGPKHQMFFTSEASHPRSKSRAPTSFSLRTSIVPNSRAVDSSSARGRALTCSL
jgi:hypothetical protein